MAAMAQDSQVFEKLIPTETLVRPVVDLQPTVAIAIADLTAMVCAFERGDTELPPTAGGQICLVLPVPLPQRTHPKGSTYLSGCCTRNYFRDDRPAITAPIRASSDRASE